MSETARHWDITLNKALSLPSRSVESRTGCGYETNPLQFRTVKGYNREEGSRGA